MLARAGWNPQSRTELNLPAGPDLSAWTISRPTGQVGCILFRDANATVCVWRNVRRTSQRPGCLQPSWPAGLPMHARREYMFQLETSRSAAHSQRLGEGKSEPQSGALVALAAVRARNEIEGMLAAQAWFQAAP